MQVYMFPCTYVYIYQIIIGIRIGASSIDRQHHIESGRQREPRFFFFLKKKETAHPLDCSV
jgi:hypothetical protein